MFKQLFDSFGEPALLREEDDFLIVAKPPGLETISQDGGPELTGLLRKARGEPGLAPAHRLDRDTSGTQLLARNGRAEVELIRLFRERRVDKTYLALCLGAPRNRRGTINRNLSEWGGGRRPVRILKKGGLEASTAYEVLAVSKELAEGFKLSVVAFSPHQGRTHQIRVHAAGLGYPILADDQYGDRPANRLAKTMLGLKRQALHSWRLSFPWKGGIAAAECPLPDDMRTAIEKAGLRPDDILS